MDIHTNLIGDVVWTHPVPVYHKQHALEAVAVAKSYFDNRGTEESPTFTYSTTNFMTTAENGPLRNSVNAPGFIDCSCFINLVLRGLDFSESPLSDMSSLSYSRSNLEISSRYPWAFDCASCFVSEEDYTGSDWEFLRTAADLAKYFYLSGRAVATGSNYADVIRPGDLVFYGNYNDRFMGIHHVSIVAENTSKCYEVSNYNWRTVFYSDIHNDVGTSREVVLVVRPFYECTHSGRVLSENLTDIPWTTISGTVNNVIVDMDEDSGTIWTGTDPDIGAASGNRQVFLKSGNDNRVYLSAGKYRLSGAPYHPDRRLNISRKLWGLRVYDPSDEDSVIPYTAFGYDSDTVTGSPSAYLIPNEHRVYDRGLGAEFTLSEGKWLCIDIYINQYPTAGIPYQNTDINADIWHPKLIRINE